MAQQAIEDHLSSFVLGMQRGPGWRAYVRDCLALWERHYGKEIADKARNLINTQLKEQKND